MDWRIKFKWQYDYAKSQLQNINHFENDWQGLVSALHDLMTTEGFDSSKAELLDTLRKKVWLENGKLVSAEKGILKAVKALSDNDVAVPDAPKMRASALKFLLHTYMLYASGNRAVWIHSLPKNFLHWPSIHLNS